MAYKNRMTVVDILLHLRKGILEGQASKDEKRLIELVDAIYILQEVAGSCGDPMAIELLDDLQYAGNHFLMKVDIKAWAAIPDIAVVQGMDVDSSRYPRVKATLVCRVAVRSELRPLTIAFTSKGEAIDPDWIGIARTEGPYKVTFDTLFYKNDGRLISWRQFESRELALVSVAHSIGIQLDEWVSCDIELADKDGRCAWQSGD